MFETGGKAIRYYHSRLVGEVDDIFVAHIARCGIESKNQGRVGEADDMSGEIWNSGAI
jgi:hypothetical protein